MSLFMPDFMFNTYRDITPEFLKKQKISALLMDIDNTFAPYEQPLPDETITHWIADMKKAGIRMAFVSNNHKSRVTKFAAPLEVAAFYDSHKPLNRSILPVLQFLNVSKEEAAVLGDQLFTDVLSGKRLGMRAICVPPIKDKTSLFFKTKRFLERPVIRQYRKSHPHEAGTPIDYSIWKQ